MNCRTARNLLFELTGDRMDRKLAKDVEKHLAVCPACRKEYDKVLSYARKMEELKKIKAPSGFLDRLNERIDRPESSGARILSFINRPYVKIPLATGALAAALLAVFLVVNPAPEPFPGETPVLRPVKTPASVSPVRVRQAEKNMSVKKDSMETKREETIVIAMISPETVQDYPASAEADERELKQDSLKTAAAPSRMKKSLSADAAPRMQESSAASPAVQTREDPVARMRSLAWEFAGSDIVEEKTDGRVTAIIFRIEASKIPSLYSALEERGLARKPFPAPPATRLPVRVMVRVP